MSTNRHERVLFFGAQNAIPLLRKQILAEKAHFIRIIIEHIKNAKQKYSESKDNKDQVLIQLDIKRHLNILTNALTRNADCSFFITPDALNDNPEIKSQLSKSITTIYQLAVKLKKKQAPSFLSRHPIHFELKFLFVTASLAAACLTTAIVLATLSAYWWLLPIGSLFGIFAILSLIGHLHDNVFRGHGLIFKADILKKYNFQPKANDIQLRNEEEQKELISLVGENEYLNFLHIKEQFDEHADPFTEPRSLR